MLASLAIAPLATPAWALKPAPIMAPRPPGPDEALIYVYRPWSFALGGRAMMIRVNGVKAIKLNTEEYSWMYLKAGPYEVALTGDLELGLMIPPKWAQATMEGGATYFTRITLQGRPNAIVGFLESTSEQQALPFIRGDFKRGPNGYKRKPLLKEAAALGATDE